MWKDESVTKNVYRRLLLEKVVPAIKEKWPRGEWSRRSTVIRIQQDGPNCHIQPDDEEFQLGLEERGVVNKIVLFTQPSNSPDLNINDLGFFRAIQSYYFEYSPDDERSLINAVLKAYDDYPKEKINRIWLTLMSCMNEIIDSGGDNSYRIPHMGKDKLEKENRLPLTIAVTKAAYDQFKDG